MSYQNCTTILRETNEVIIGRKTLETIQNRKIAKLTSPKKVSPIHYEGAQKIIQNHVGTHWDQANVLSTKGIPRSIKNQYM